MAAVLARAECAYARCYCEENVFKLAEKVLERGDEAAVVWISNKSQTVAMWSQRASRADRPHVVWDYHVVLVTWTEPERTAVVLDLDTTLGWPVPLDAYCAGSFRAGLRARLEPSFRVASARDFVALFSSDRSHMLGPDGEYKVAPPPWPRLLPSSRAIDIRCWWNVTDARAAPGVIVDLNGLEAAVAALREGQSER